MKTLFIYLSINHGDFEEFEFHLEDNAYDQVEKAYQEESSKKGFENEKFWSNLKVFNPELADTIVKAINEELTHYIFEDDWIPDVDGVERAENNFPLYDLHFDYFTEDDKKTMRHCNCTRFIIYANNEYDCDFSYSFE